MLTPHPLQGQTGMVLGKFLPPHAGHVYLIEFARQCVERLTVVVGSLEAEPIPGALRVQWLKTLFPRFCGASRSWGRNPPAKPPWPGNWPATTTPSGSPKESQGLPYTIISGNWEERWQQALQAVEDLAPAALSPE